MGPTTILLHRLRALTLLGLLPGSATVFPFVAISQGRVFVGDFSGATLMPGAAGRGSLKRTTGKPVEDYLRVQRRFQHLFSPERCEQAIKKIQQQVDDYWATI